MTEAPAASEHQLLKAGRPHQPTTIIPVAFINGPWGHGGEGLLPQPARTHRTVRVARRRGRWVLLSAEFSGRAAEVWALHKMWTVLRAPLNDWAPRRRGVMNAIQFRDGKVDLDDHLSLRFRVPRRVRPLHMPAARLVEEQTGAALTAVAGHDLGRRAGSDKTRDWVNRKLVTWCVLAYAATGDPVVVGIDKNDRLLKVWLEHGFTVAAHDDVCYILVLGAKVQPRDDDGVIDDGVGGVITDHGSMLAADILVPTPSNGQPTNTPLPRLTRGRRFKAA